MGCWWTGANGSLRNGVCVLHRGSSLVDIEVKTFKLTVNISGQVFTEFTQAASESGARRNIARRLETKLGLLTGALTPKLFANSDSVHVAALAAQTSSSKDEE